MPTLRDCTAFTCDQSEWLYNIINPPIIKIHMNDSPTRKHNRDSFYKYVSLNTAKIILKNRTLRWSSPLEFNDPFDVPRELLYGVTPAEIKKETNNIFADLIKNPPENTEGLQPKIKSIVDAIKNSNAKGVKNKIVSAIQLEGVEEDLSSPALEGMRQFWRDLIPEFRILCLCESHKKASMWYHYAEKYKGVVIELSCSNKKVDSALLMAEPINYIESVPEISTALGWAQILFMPKKAMTEKLFKLATYTKTPDWEYEKEWRVTSFRRPRETGTFSDYSFNHKELKSIYLGPLMNIHERHELLHLARKFSPHTIIYETEIGMNRHFNFKQIAG